MFLFNSFSQLFGRPAPRRRKAHRAVRVRRRLIVEPLEHRVVLSTMDLSGFLGGSLADQGASTAVDGAGNTYVVGSTSSTDFPATAGAFDNSHNGNDDAFIAKFDPTGSLLWATYLGGSNADGARDVAVDGAGDVYVSGITSSSDFPTTADAFDTSHNGSFDAWVAKIAPDGTSLVYSTYLGGSRADFAGSSIAVDASGNAYVTGGTRSFNFPTTVGAFDTTHNGGQDAFVTKLNSSGTALVYSTYIGGSDASFSEHAFGITVDASGSAHVAGRASSTNFPTTAGAFQTVYGGGTHDLFVLKLNAAGSALDYSTYLGGSGRDAYPGGGNMLALDSAGNAYVTGQTTSVNFPTTPGALDTTHNGGEDALVAKLNPSGTALVYSTYLGGIGNDTGFAIALDTDDKAHVAGQTASTDFPVADAVQSTYGGGTSDAFVARASADGTGLEFSTFLGGSSIDLARGLALDSDENVYAVGHTASADFPTTAGAFDTSHNGNTDAFFTRLSTVVDVDIDIKPGSAPNPINLKGGGVLPVAILSTPGFDALDVDVATIELGDPNLSGQSSPIRVAQEDVDGDGNLDLLLFFRIPDLLNDGALNEDSTDLALTGKLMDGTDIVGSDSVRIVPKKK